MHVFTLAAARGRTHAHFSSLSREAEQVKKSRGRGYPNQVAPVSQAWALSLGLSSKIKLSVLPQRREDSNSHDIQTEKFLFSSALSNSFRRDSTHRFLWTIWPSDILCFSSLSLSLSLSQDGAPFYIAELWCRSLPKLPSLLNSRQINEKQSKYLLAGRGLLFFPDD